MRPFLVPILACACALLTVSPAARAGEPPVRVGIPQTFFHDLSAEQVKTLTEPFVDVMKETTGMTGIPVTGGDPFAVAKQVADKKFTLGVFFGTEFAWVRTKYPELKTLMIVLDGKKDSRSYVLVPKDSPAQSFADLKGKRVAVPSRTKQPARLFVDRLAIQQGASGFQEFAVAANRSGNVETTLNGLALRKFDAALVDAHGLEFYKDLHPALFNRMRVVATSEPFPPAVIAYQPGVLPEAALKLIANGLGSAVKTDSGQEMMKLWRINGFAAVPADYEQRLSATLKAYPAVESK